MNLKKRLLSLMITLSILISMMGIMPAMTASAYNYYYFTPSYTGVYYFTCNDCNGSANPYVLADDDQTYYRLPLGNGIYHYYLVEGIQYILYFSDGHDGHGISYGETYYKKLGQLYTGTTNVSVNGELNTQTYYYYYFNPTQSGQYRITSIGSNSDPKVIITDKDLNVYYCFDDTDNYYRDYNEIINLTANQGYFFSFYDYWGASSSVINISYIPSATTSTTTKPKTATAAKPSTTTTPKKTTTKKISKPGKVKISYSFNPKTKKIKVKWKKVKGATGYQYKVSLKKKYKKAKSKSTKKKSFSYKIKFNKKYKIGVRAYKKVGNKKVYGKWTTITKGYRIYKV